MHDEILTEAQIRLLPLVKDFSGRFGLVGGTAIALHLGHRRSVDFDLFTFKPFRRGMPSFVCYIPRFTVSALRRDSELEGALLF